jgi:hypothetical protein
MALKLRLAIAALLGTGCSAASPQFWALPEGAGEVLILVEGKSGVRVETFLHRIDASARWTFTPEEGDRRLVLIGLSEAELDAWAPERDRGRELSAAVNVPSLCCFPDGKREELALRLPSAHAVLQGDLEPGASLIPGRAQDLPYFEGLALTIPLAAERCRRFASEAVTPFAASLSLLPDGGVFGPVTLQGLPSDDMAYASLNSAAALDEDRVVLGGASAVLVARRGEAYVPDPAHAYFLPDVGVAADEWRGANQLAVDPRDRSHVVVVGQDKDQRGHLWELQLGSPITLTSSLSTDRRLTSVAYADNGDLYIGGDRVLMVRRAGSAVFEAQAIDVLEIFRVLVTANTLVLGASGSSVLVGDVATRTFRSLQVPIATPESVRALALTQTSAGRELWIGLSGGRAFRLVDGLTRFEPLYYQLPTSALGCGRVQHECGYVTLVGTVRELLPVGPDLLAVLTNCGGSLSIRAEDGCTRALMNEPARELVGSADQWYAGALVGPDHAVVVGTNLRVGWIDLR